MKLKQIVTFSQAYNSVLKRISLRDYTCSEIKLYLKRRECPADIAQAVIDKMLSLNYLNDERLCANLCHSWQARGTLGRKLFKLKLVQRGLAASLVESCLAKLELENKNCEYEKANKLFHTYTKKIKKFDDKTLAKITRHLAGKGFTYSVINAVLKDNKELLSSLATGAQLDTYFKNLYN